MKIKHSKPKGQRILRSTHKHRPLWIQPLDFDLNFSYAQKQWQTWKTLDKSKGVTTAYYAMEHAGLKDVWSLKAALRRIRKWNVPKGTVFNVSLPYEGYSFEITKK